MYKIKKQKKGGGILNYLIDKVGEYGINLTLPGYRYCGPGNPINNGTPVNKLDESCFRHDLAFSKHSDLEARHKADKILIEEAWERAKSKDAPLSERAAALLVTNLMKVKTKLEMGLKKSKGSGIKKSLASAFKKVACGKKKIKQCKKNNSSKTQYMGGGFNSALKKIKKTLKESGEKNIEKAVKIALKTSKNLKIKKKLGTRIIPIPKLGGSVLGFLIPLLASLTGVGAIAGDASNILQTIKNITEAKKGGGIKKVHKDLTLAPYKRGMGLYLRPYNFDEHRKN